MRNLPPFLALVWRTSRGLATLAVLLRLARALLPVLLLFVGKLIIDEVVRLAGLPNRPATLAGWLLDGRLARLALLVAAEFALAIADDVCGRVVAYVESLLSPSIRENASPRPFPRPIETGFAFENVGFRYPGSERWAVRGLSFRLAAGEVVALVGENGAGKTTVVKLLSRLYDPSEGRITLDGHDLRDYDPAALRERIGVIFQDFVRYNLTAADNIAVGRIESRDDRPRIERAARLGLADAVVARLPGRYDQMIGKSFANGVELSGGEWQKLAIARAYMRDAAVLILDEPTAALDARAEAEVFGRFRDLSRGRTGVLISHRFSSARLAHRILVLADGRIEATGTHDELVARRGRYAELFELQAQGYR